MYQIKQFPSDFIVKEIGSINLENGQHSYYILKKTNCTTMGALEALSKRLKIPLKHFGFAGNKDKNAVTEQKISIFRGSKHFENFKFNNIELRYLGNGNEPISLGDLHGNEFVIIIRNLNNKEIKKIQNLENKKLKIPNLYGPQRFSKNNHLAGKAIVKRDFTKAVDLVLENSGIVENKIEDYLKNNKNNYIGALRLIPLKTRKMLVHSYQSFLFNKIANKYLKRNKSQKNLKIPIIGFDFEFGSIKDIRLKDIFKKITNEEELNPRDFIINQMPELSSEGSSRDLFFELKDLKILEISNGELSQNKKKIKINFTLPKSCYATVALEYFFQQP